MFNCHHFAAMISVFLAFIFMIFLGFFLDHKIFQIPAAASIIIFFALMISIMGALTYFLQTWSVLFVILLYLTLNILYPHDVIDTRNKAYGLNYGNKKERPTDTNAHLLELCNAEKSIADKAAMLEILNHWKINQNQEKPVMVFLNFSGGGVRSASFAMNVLQNLDSITGGRLMQRTFLMSGASG